MKTFKHGGEKKGKKKEREGAAGGGCQRKSLMRTKAPERSAHLGAHAGKKKALFDF